MQVSAVRVWVDDFDKAKRFYGDALGLAINWEQEGAVGYDCGATLIIEQDDGEHPGLVGRFTGVSFEVADIAAAVGALAGKGVPSGGAPAHFNDPSSNVLTLVS